MAWEWLIPTVLGALGGLGGGGNVTQTTQMIPPPPNTQQQILLNQMMDWLYQVAPQYQGYINQTLQSIYGGAPGTPTVGEGYMGEKVPGQLTGELGEEYQTAVQTEADYQRNLENYETAKKVTDAFQTISENNAKLEAWKAKYGESGEKIPGGITGNKAWGERNTIQRRIVDAESFLKGNFTDIEWNKMYEMYQKDPEGFTADYLGVKPTPTGVPEEARIHGAVGEGLTDPRLAAEATAAEPAWSPFQEIMSWTPEKIAEYYGIEKTKQQREIEDWYGQAQREASQRGISQYGGYEGSGMARDVALLAAEKARMSTSLSESMRQLQLAHEMKQPYDMLSAAQGLLGTVSGLQAPWLQMGQYLGTPYGPTTQVSTQPGASATQGALAGAMTGAGLYGMGQGLGWWGTSQPATPYGAGLTGPQIYQQSPFQLTGAQNWWNQSPWTFGG